ncbi:MAG TPA: IS110 family transposase [Solirubrobacteraceae bacterium]|nr:IS110 family transposase [Solirubrobacteraceae bacterium]
MRNHRTLVGLDVHARATVAAVLELESGELRFRRVGGPPRSVVNYLEELPGPVLAVYEAGPLGYGLARATTLGIEVVVCAPGSIPRKPGDRVKTDRRDAERLVRSLLAGELSFVRVPTVEEEQFRDLARCREAARGDLMRARHRLGRFLVRRELEFPGPGGSWTEAHRRWLGSLEFADHASRSVFADYLAGVAFLEQRRGGLDAQIEIAAPCSPWAVTIANLRCLRGISTTTAYGLCSEVGDFRRFERPSGLSAYLGIVPSEHSSGESINRGPITKAGSPHARRLLIEAAQHYRHKPSVSATLARRQRGHDPRACEIGWRCQQRLYRQWQRLRFDRGKPGNVVITALARELSNFVWEIGQLN